MQDSPYESGMTRRELLRIGALAAAGYFFSPGLAAETLSPAQLSPAAPVLEPKHFFRHAVHSPGHQRWHSDGFDQFADGIALESRLLQLSSSEVLYCDSRTNEVVDTYKLSGKELDAWQKKENPELARAYTLGIAKGKARGIAQAKGDAKRTLIGRVGFAELLARGVEEIAPFAPYLETIAERNGIDPALPIALALQETVWTPRATSKANCHGVFQMNVRNARSYGLHIPEKGRYGVNESFAPLTQAYAAMALFRTNILLSGNAVIATSYYHAGEGNVLKMMGAAMSLDRTIEKPIDAFAWAVRNYRHPVNTGGFSGFGHYSAHYPLRVLAFKDVVQLPKVTPIMTDAIKSVKGLRMRDVFASFGIKSVSQANEQTALFKLLNPHLLASSGALAEMALPIGIDVYLPAGEGERFVHRHGGSFVRYAGGKITPEPACTPWLELDTAYTRLAAKRVESITAVEKAQVNDLGAQATRLSQEFPSQFRTQQQRALEADQALFATRGYLTYQHAEQRRELPTRRQRRAKSIPAKKTA